MAFLPATFLAESPDVDVYAREPVQANYVASPDPDTQWRTGTQPLDTLPTQWWNYFNNLYTERMNTTNKYLKQVIAEIADCVGAAIDNTDSLQLKQAVTDKIDALKQQVDALEDRVDDLDVTTTTPNSVTTSTNSAGSSTHAARADHTHAIADSAVTRAKIAASTITADRLARVTPGSASTTAVAIAQAYNAALATKLANAGLVSVQTSIPSTATNEAAYCVPNVAAVRSFMSSSSTTYTASGSSSPISFDYIGIGQSETVTFSVPANPIALAGTASIYVKCTNLTENTASYELYVNGALRVSRSLSADEDYAEVLDMPAWTTARTDVVTIKCTLQAIDVYVLRYTVSSRSPALVAYSLDISYT